MGNALALRLSSTQELQFYDHHEEKANHLAQAGYGKAFKNILDAIHLSEMIILAVKPQNLQEVAELINDHIQKNQVIVSLLAGISLNALRQSFPQREVVRMMPNLPIIYGEGVIGLSVNDHLKEIEKDHLMAIFKPLGTIYWLPEEKFEALTALAGSGPAFFFVMVEAMVDAGIAMGFNSKDAQGVVYQMLQGSLTLLEKTRKHPGELKWQVTSPKGTTISGLRVLEEHALRGAIINTFLATYNRAKDMS